MINLYFYKLIFFFGQDNESIALVCYYLIRSYITLFSYSTLISRNSEKSPNALFSLFTFTNINLKQFNTDVKSSILFVFPKILVLLDINFIDGTSSRFVWTCTINYNFRPVISDSI